MPSCRCLLLLLPTLVFLNGVGWWFVTPDGSDACLYRNSYGSQSGSR